MREYISEYIEKKVLKLEKEFDKVKKFIKDIIKERKGHYLTKRIDAYESPK